MSGNLIILWCHLETRNKNTSDLDPRCARNLSNGDKVVCAPSNHSSGMHGRNTLPLCNIRTCDCRIPSQRTEEGISCKSNISTWSGKLDAHLGCTESECLQCPRSGRGCCTHWQRDCSVMSCC